MTLFGPNYYVEMVVIGGTHGNMEWIFMMVLSPSWLYSLNIVKALGRAIVFFMSNHGDSL